MPNVTQLIETIRNNQRRILQIRTECLIDEPIIDANGNLHAPTNNYVWHNRTYRAGEFMEDDESFAPTKITLIFTDAAFRELNALDSLGITYSTGKPWQIHTGETLFYVYFSGVSKKAVDAINKMLPHYNPDFPPIRLIAEVGHYPNAKSWAFSAGRLINNLSRKFYHNEYMYAEAIYSHDFPMIIDVIKGKKKYTSPWDKMEVRYLRKDEMDLIFRA